MPIARATKVVDASALAALVFREAQADTVAASLEGARLVAPELLSFEMANVCVVKCRRQPELKEVFLKAFAASFAMTVELVPANVVAVTALALETGLTAYDASYLWVAREIGAELVTLDKALQAHA